MSEAAGSSEPIAIFHVMISHFAVGGGFYLALAERKAMRDGRSYWCNVLRGHAKFFLVLTGVFGAVSGVGIWFSIGLANPEATSTLIHNFVFAWAIEWVFFMVELTTAAVYYYTWGRISSQLHMKVAWVYAGASFCTLFIINGILTFMLTPGAAWLSVAGTGAEATKFWQAFFNPTFWPSLGLRMAVCVSLAGIWALITTSRINGSQFPDLKIEMVRWSAKWLLPSFLLMPFLLGWYFWSVPESQRQLLSLGISTIGSGAFTQVTRTALVIVMTSATVVAVVYFLAYRNPARFQPVARLRGADARTDGHRLGRVRSRDAAQALRRRSVDVRQRRASKVRRLHQRERLRSAHAMGENQDGPAHRDG